MILQNYFYFYNIFSAFEKPNSCDISWTFCVMIKNNLKGSLEGVG